MGEPETPVPCLHRWVAGPFFVQVAVTWEEPRFYAPQGSIGVEHCTWCGLLRLDDVSRRRDGSNLHSGGGA